MPAPPPVDRTPEILALVVAYCDECRINGCCPVCLFYGHAPSLQFHHVRDCAPLEDTGFAVEARDLRFHLIFAQGGPVICYRCFLLPGMTSTKGTHQQRAVPGQKCPHDDDVSTLLLLLFNHKEILEPLVAVVQRRLVSASGTRTSTSSG
jgi:hypothetical protein